jgi:hypothetical protein
MLKAYKDAFGKIWYAAQLEKMPVTLDDGDYILFSPEQGFAISLGHVLKDHYTYFGEYQNVSNEVMFPNEIIQEQVEEDNN